MLESKMPAVSLIHDNKVNDTHLIQSSSLHLHVHKCFGCPLPFMVLILDMVKVDHVLNHLPVIVDPAGYCTGEGEHQVQLSLAYEILDLSFCQKCGEPKFSG